MFALFQGVSDYYEFLPVWRRAIDAYCAGCSIKVRQAHTDTRLVMATDVLRAFRPRLGASLPLDRPAWL